METPEIRFVQRDNLHIAYFTAGNGPPDLVYVPNWTSNIEVFWERGPFGRFIKRLTQIGRVIAFDQPGNGISDPVPLESLPTMEDWVNDVRVVMDAAGSERATLVAEGAAGALAILFAATHPDRTNALVLIGSFARLFRDEDYAWAFPPEGMEEGIERWMKVWGTGRQLWQTAPSVADDPDEVFLMGRAERQSASPSVARAYFRIISQLDVRDVLPAVRVPTLVVHRTGDRWISVEHGRYLAEHIPGARLVEVPGDDHFFFYGDMRPLIDPLRDLVAQVREHEEGMRRVLATFLFTDIVDSTRRAVALGDRRWKETLDSHDAAVRTELERFGGREVKTTGDGFLATFEGPARAIRCALAIRDRAQRLGLDIRAGLHTGECELRDGGDVGGIAVHVGARILGEAGVSEVLASQTVKDLTIGSGIGFEDRGARPLRGVPGEWRIYAVR